jgi:dihydrofolate synthase / folylpolyglutamate synthase
VTAMVEAALRAAGTRTGRYTSPHLLDLTERVAVNGSAVSSADLVDAVETVRHTVDRLRERGTLDVHPTFFEVTTAAAFELFRREAVDIAVCEVGLGGRLDATNVLSPMVCAITSISVDHQQYLGHTLHEIAAEKAGIIKRHTPVVVGAVESDAAITIGERAHECNAPLVWAMAGVRVADRQTRADGSQQFSLRTPTRDYGQVRLALAGDHQVNNAIVAVRVLEQLEEAGVAIGPEPIATGLGNVRWPGRMERVALPGGREALLDAAHNAAGAEALARHLLLLGEPRPLVFAAMRDKEVTAMLRALAPRVSHVVLTRASNLRSAEPEELREAARRVAPTLSVEMADTAAAALSLAWTRSPRIVVAGSIFLLADVMKELHRS